MDGIHDLGGMHGFGPVRVERDEPVFHARWEGRVYALTGATGGSFAPNIDKFRHAIERMDPVEYLSAGYYGRWLRAIETRLVEAGELAPGAVDRLARELARKTARERRQPAAANLRQAQRSRRRRRPEQPPIQRRNESPTARARGSGARSIERRDSTPATPCARATSIPPVTRACPATSAASEGASRRSTPPTSSPTPTRTTSARSRSTCTASRSRAKSCGAPEAEPGTSVHLDLFEPYLESRPSPGSE